MFGYVRPCKPEMKVRDFDAYRAVYCGVCHALGRRYSVIMRLILSYDVTFLALFAVSLNPDCAGFEKKRCPAHPFRRRACSRVTGDVEFAADCGVLLFYYKLRDNLRDAGLSRKLGAAALLPIASLAHRKAARLRPEAEKIAREYIEAQSAAEKAGAGIDPSADPTARMMADLLELAAQGRALPRVTRRMGYFLGRWIYLADALDDLERDSRSGDFNPFLTGANKAADIPGARQTAVRMLNSCVYEISAAFELLEFRRFRPIVENIVYMGLPDMAEKVRMKKKIMPL